MFKLLRRFMGKKKEEKKAQDPKPLTLKDKARQKYKDQYLGKILHYYGKIKVGIIRVERSKLKVGDTIYIQGSTTRFKQKVNSIEYNHRKVKTVGPGYEIGIRIGARVREDDDVYVMQA